MKNNWLKIFRVFAFFLLFTASSFANDTAKTVVIKTTAQCGMCKERIENALAKEDGVFEAVLDMETKEAAVKYSAVETDENAIRDAIAKLGYDADDVKKNMRAYKKLPKCCKLPEDR